MCRIRWIKLTRPWTSSGTKWLIRTLRFSSKCLHYIKERIWRWRKWDGWLGKCVISRAAGCVIGLSIIFSVVFTFWEILCLKPICMNVYQKFVFTHMFEEVFWFYSVTILIEMSPSGPAIAWFDRYWTTYTNPWLNNKKSCAGKKPCSELWRIPSKKLTRALCLNLLHCWGVRHSEISTLFNLNHL